MVGQMKRPSKEEYYLDIAKEVAKRGTCIRRIVGVVIVKDDTIVSTGYVGSPRGTDNCIDLALCFRKEAGIPSGQRYELCKSVHAEQNAIINASRTGSTIFGGVMYLSDEKNIAAYASIPVGQRAQTEDYGPCSICKKAIINSGLREVIIKSGKNIKRLNIEDIKKELVEEESRIRGIKNEN